MKKLLLKFLSLTMTVSGFSQDAIEKYFPESTQTQAKEFASYLVYTVNYVKGRAGKDANLKTLDQLSEQAHKSYLAGNSKLTVSSKASNTWKAQQFTEFVNTENGSREYKQMLQEIADALYNNGGDGATFVRKLTKVASNPKLKSLTARERTFIQMEVAFVFYCVKALAINNYHSSNSGLAKEKSWFQEYLEWYGSLATPKCVLGTIGGTIGGALAGAAVGGAAGAGIGAVPGAVVGGVGGLFTGASASCFE